MGKTEKAMDSFFKNRGVAWVIVGLVILASFANGLSRDDARLRAVVYDAFDSYMWPIIQQGSQHAFNLGVIAARNGVDNQLQAAVTHIMEAENISDRGAYFTALANIAIDVENAVLAANVPDSELDLMHNLIVNFEESQLMFRQSNYNNIARNFNENIRFMGSDMPVFD